MSELAELSAKVTTLQGQIRHGEGLPSDALKITADFINASLDARDAVSCEIAISLVDQLLTAKITSSDKALLYYFLSNAWNAKNVSSPEHKLTIWDWKQEPLEEQLFALRKACQESGFDKLHNINKAQIFTNLANLLNHLRRFPESIEYYDKALAILPSFGMAIGNKARALFDYSRALYDKGHQVILLSQAIELLEVALQHPKLLEPDAERNFREFLSELKPFIKNPEKCLQTLHRADSIGDSPEEIAYRKWCLENRLFLNPLNDLGAHAITAHDPFSLPTITTGKNARPWFWGFFNQLKQEYVSARYMLYEGISAEHAHFSDKDTHLVDTLDYASLSLNQEQVKIGFRMAYSILDKVAFFMNEYYAVGLKHYKISFRNIWYQDVKQKDGKNARKIRQSFIGSKNLSLRGLFWLSRDLFEQDSKFVTVLEPDAQKINSIRNALEHKYLKIIGHDGAVSTDDELMSPYDDNLAMKVSRRDFALKSLKLLKLVRASLIYLSCAVNHEERYKEQINGFVAPMHQTLLKDEWKV